VGAAKGKANLERRVRQVIETKQFPETFISPGMTQEGLVFFPVVPLKAVRLVLVDKNREATRTLEVGVVLPPTPLQVSQTEDSAGKLKPQP
jgi:hypothetical protein